VTHNDKDDDDLFEAIAKERGLAPPGDYVGELLVAVPFSTARTQGHEATIKITEGTHANRLLKIRFITDGPASVDGIIANNAAVLDAWWTEIGVEGRPSRRDGFDGVFKALWQCGQDKRLIFGIDIRSSGRFSENILTEVRWDVL
jgi:hypothetical protein